MNLAIIPARGGSKRIPKKNIKHFVEKPLIAFSIEAALKSSIFDKVWVSTDSEEVAEVARHYGAEVPFIRPATLSDDMTGTRAVTNHAIEYCIEHGEKPEYCCCIYATAPFLKSEFLIEGLEALKNNSAMSFSLSVTSFAFPIQRAISIKQHKITPMYPEAIPMRSQDLEEAYHDAGQFYWGRTDDYLSTQSMFSEKSIPIILPRHLVQDIDTPEDWKRAELMYNAYVKDQ